MRNGGLVLLGARTFRSLRRHHNYRLFFTGQIVSFAGSWMQNVALAWLVLDLSRSPLAVGALVFFRFLPVTVLGLFAGVIVDRWDIQRMLIATQAVQMALSAALAAVTLSGTATLPLVYALAALLGLVLVLDSPGRQAFTFELVGPRELPNAVALNSGIINGARVIGPAIAGVLIATAGTGACFVVNAVSYLAVLVALGLIRRDELHPVAKDPTASLLSGTGEGIRFAASDPVIRTVLLVVAAVSVLGFNFNTLVPLLASDALHVGAAAFGLLSAVVGAGAVVGSLGAAQRGSASWRVFVVGAAGFSATLLLLAPVSDAWIAGVLLFSTGVFFTLFVSTASALVQLGAPDRLRGRVAALFIYAFIGLAPLGGLVSGLLVEGGGTELAFALGGCIGLVASALAYRSLSSRAPGRAATGVAHPARGPQGGGSVRVAGARGDGFRRRREVKSQTAEAHHPKK